MENRKKERFIKKHGRTVEETAACVAYVKEWWPGELAHRMRIAEEVTERIFLFDLPWDMEQTAEPVEFAGEIDWMAEPAGDPEFVYQLNRHRYWICLGQAYAVTGEEKYARCFVEQMMHWIVKNPITEKTGPKTWRTIEAGLRVESWIKAMGYMAESPAVTEEVFDLFLEALVRHGAYLAACDVPFSVKSNWGVLENSGLYAAGCVLRELEVCPEGAAYMALAKQRLTRQMEVQVMDDGVHWEQSPMYHNEVLKCYLEVLRLAELYGDPFPESVKKKTAAMAYADRIWQKPDGSQPAGGDSDETDLRDILTICGYWFLDPVLKSGGYERMDYEGIWDYGSRADRAYRMIGTKNPPDTFSWMKDSGNWYLRSSWGTDADYLHVRCGALGGGHGHFDKLHLDLTIGGEELFVDPGRYTYVDGDLRRQLKSAGAHNSVTVDRTEYSHCLDSWDVSGLYPAGKGNCCRKGSYTLIECGHLGYIDRGVYVERRVIAVGTRIYLIADTCYGAGEHTYEQHFHIPSGIERRQAGERRLHLLGKCFQAELICVSDNTVMTEEKFSRSRHYNQLESGRLVTFGRSAEAGEGVKAQSIVTAVVCQEPDSAKKVSVSRVPVVSPVSRRILEAEEAEGIEICCGEQAYLIVLAHVETGADCEYIGARGSYGLGRVMVTDESRTEPEMTVLAW